MSAKELLASAASATAEETVKVGNGEILVRQAPAHEVISAAKYAGGDRKEDEYRLAITCLSIVEADGSRPLVTDDGDLAAGIESLRKLPGGVQISLAGAAMRVNGFQAGN